MSSSLNNTTPANTYPALIKVSDNTPIDATLKTLSDGSGNNLPIQASSSTINFTGTTTGLPFQDFGLYAYQIVASVVGGTISAITSATAPSGANLISATGWSFSISGVNLAVTHPLGDTILLGTSQGYNPPIYWIRQYSGQSSAVFAMIQNSAYTVVTFYSNTATNAGFSSSQSLNSGLRIVFFSTIRL